ncbi:GNAT family N-acetyltransferase [Legionella sp. km772]|uniref:GNAT family N-acetyltransferase n=1 Tax=Legionella sp. km772 TaxID=2498111 RepID=UPI000F8F57B3|nr:GNAT family N-acetyltransferase [Legionella sp. km772]RUR10429.1 GNAT family N-acetyltransferase [Legionella sp. km772]
MDLYNNYTFFVVFNDGRLVAGFSVLIMDNLAHEGAPSAMLDDVLLAAAETNTELLCKSILNFALQLCQAKACYKLCVANPQLLPPELLRDESSVFSQHGLCFVKELVKKEKPTKAFSLVNKGVALREASKSDLEAILTLYQQPGMDERVLAAEAATVLYLKMCANPHYKIYVALIDKKVVGTFALLMVPSIVHQESYLAIIEDVMVDPKTQGRGVGKLMIEFALELAEKMGCYKLALSSNKKRESAHGFYRILGFVESGASLLVHSSKAKMESAEQTPRCTV